MNKNFIVISSLGRFKRKEFIPHPQLFMKVFFPRTDETNNNNKSLSCCRCIVGCIKIRRRGNYIPNKFIDSYQPEDEWNHIAADKYEYCKRHFASIICWWKNGILVLFLLPFSVGDLNFNQRVLISHLNDFLCNDKLFSSFYYFSRYQKWINESSCALNESDSFVPVLCNILY